MSLERRDLLRLAAAGLLAPALGSHAHGAAAGSLPEVPGDHGRRLRLARIKALHLHNQPAGGPLHRTLLELWERVFDKTGGGLLVTPLPLDANLPAADVEAVNRVADGTFQLVSVAAPILDTLLPDMGLQSLPYVYRSSVEAVALANTEAFGDAVGQALAGSSLVYLPGGVFSNGLRVTTTRAGRPLKRLADFAGLKIRIPPSEDLSAIVTALGAAPVAIPIAGMRHAIASGEVDAQENPVTVIDAFKLDEVVHWINLTHHMWTGFNTLAHAGFWQGLPAGVRDAVIEELPAFQRLQVERQETSNANLLTTLQASRGMNVMATDTSGAQRLMTPVYRSMYQRMSPAARRLAEPLIAPLLER